MTRPVARDPNSLDGQLHSLIANFSGTIAIHARNLTTGATVVVDDARVGRCASEAKIFILLTYARQVATGRLTPTQRVDLRQSDLKPGSGVMRFASPGLQPTLTFLAYLMMTVSDNTATNMLMDAVGGPAAIQAEVARLAIPDTTIHGKVWAVGSGWIESSARGVAAAAAVLAEPARHGYPQSAADLCCQIMAHHYEDNGLVRFLPWSPFASDLEAFDHLTDSYAGISVYGKAGYRPGYRGDVALFVTPKSRYVLGLRFVDAVGTRPLNAANPGFTFSAEIGRLLYDWWG